MPPRSRDANRMIHDGISGVHARHQNYIAVTTESTSKSMPFIARPECGRFVFAQPSPKTTGCRHNLFVSECVHTTPVCFPSCGPFTRGFADLARHERRSKGDAAVASSASPALKKNSRVIHILLPLLPYLTMKAHPRGRTSWSSCLQSQFSKK